MDEDYEDVQEETSLVVTLNPIAQPLADSKLTKRLYKLIKKSSAKKNKLYRGLKNVQTKIRKEFSTSGGNKAICVLAGDVTPIDIYCHLPIVCEDRNIPYCFVASKRAIAEALGAKRPCIVALITADEDYQELYDKCYSKVSSLSC
jgi:H/ACA ribonucleoprotein complex subunit 2